MTKKRLLNILSYILIVIMIVFSVYKEIDLIIKVRKDAQVNIIIGIVVFAIVIIMAFVCLFTLIRADIYRNRVIKNQRK